MKKPDPELDALQEDYARQVGPMINRFMLLGTVRKKIIDAEAEAAWLAEEATWKSFDVFEIGDRVVIKGSALFAMGQRSGRDAARTWTVTECGCELCQTGRLAAVDHWVDEIGWRHIARTALRHAGQPTVDELPVAQTTQDTACIQNGIRDGFLRRGRWADEQPANETAPASLSTEKH